MKLQTNLTNALLLIGLTLMAVVWLVPFVMIINTALRAQGDLLSNGIFVLPQKIAWTNFVRAWETGNFSTYFRNSSLLIVMKVPLGILIAALAAYALAKLRFRWNQAIFIFFLIGLTIPVHVTLIPLLTMMKQIGIEGSLFALLPPYVVFGLPFQIFVLRGFFRTIPSELLEAARLDGSSEWGIFWRIMLPL